MSYEKIVKFVQELSRLTEQQKIKWEQTYEEGLYQVSFPSYSVTISTRPSIADRTSIDIVITISNKQGTVVEEVSDIHLASDLESSYNFMKSIYDNARRSAMGVDIALDELMEELQEKDDLF